MSSESAKEILEARYHARFLQVRRIFDEAHLRAIREIEEHYNAARSLDTLLHTPALILNLNFVGDKEGKARFMQDAVEGLGTVFTVHALRVIVGNLCLAVDPSKRVSKEVAVDHVDPLLTQYQEALEIGFAKDPERYRDAVTDGRAKGISLALGFTERSDMPLLRLPINLARQKGINLTPTLDGGAVSFIPTKIDGVDLRSYYPPQTKAPQLSFRVSPLS